MTRVVKVQEWWRATDTFSTYHSLQPVPQHYMTKWGHMWSIIQWLYLSSTVTSNQEKTRMAGFAQNVEKLLTNIYIYVKDVQYTEKYSLLFQLC